MEQSEISPKEMVITVLRESKKPLMAKKIAYNIYKKYNGYRLSRFRVRDILWKEMKGLYEYDEENYTYWIDKSKLLDSEINIRKQYELKIDGEGKNNNDGALIREMFYDEKVHPFLYSFKYNFPTKISIRLSIANWKKKILGKVLIPNNDLVHFYNACDAIEDHCESEQDWVLILNSIRKYKLETDDLTLSSEYKALNENLLNPFHYILLQLEFQQEKNFIKFNNQKFQILFEEIARDNRITLNEQNYLIDKAAEYGIERSRVLNAIETIDFKGYGSFKYLIDEICEDGVVTEIERKYINEKAEEYNVPQSQLERMITAGLLKVEIINQYKGEMIFYEYVKLIFLMNALKIEFDTSIFEKKALEEKDDFIEILNKSIANSVSLVLLKIKELFGIEIKCSSIDEIIKNLGLIPKSFESALRVDAKTTKNYVITEFDKINEKLEDHWNVIIDNTISRQIEIDYFKRSLRLKNNYGKNESQIFIEFISKLFDQKVNHRNPEVDLFFENFEEFYDNEK